MVLPLTFHHGYGFTMRGAKTLSCQARARKVQQDQGGYKRNSPRFYPCLRSILLQRLDRYPGDVKSMVSLEGGEEVAF